MSISEKSPDPGADRPAAPPIESHLGFAPAARALDRLAVVLPSETARAKSVLAEVLLPMTRSPWPEISHRLSLLTNSGLPVEFEWTTRQQAVRWTAEVAGPETPKEMRLATAAARAGIDVGWLSDIQAGQRLRYGAWLSGRHHADHDEFKVYAEVPTGALAPALTLHPTVGSDDLEWRMVGVAPDGTTEIYGRGAIDKAVIDGHESAAFGTSGSLASAISELLGTDELPPRSLFSVTLGAEGAAVGLTWFGFARISFDDHEAAVAALANFTSDDRKRAVLLALADTVDDGKWRIGLVGVGIDAHGETWAQASVRPS